MKTEALIIKKSRKRSRLKWRRKQRPRCLHELGDKNEPELMVILLLNFRVEIFQLEAKWNF